MRCQIKAALPSLFMVSKVKGLTIMFVSFHVCVCELMHDIWCVHVCVCLAKFLATTQSLFKEDLKLWELQSGSATLSPLLSSHLISSPSSLFSSPPPLVSSTFHSSLPLQLHIKRTWLSGVNSGASASVRVLFETPHQPEEKKNREKYRVLVFFGGVCVCLGSGYGKSSMSAAFENACCSNLAVQTCLWPSWVSPPLLCEHWSTDAPLHSRLESDSITVLSPHTRDHSEAAWGRPWCSSRCSAPNQHHRWLIFVFYHTRLLTSTHGLWHFPYVLYK